MSIKENFIKNIKKGDIVEIIYSNKEKEVSGEVTAIDESCVCISGVYINFDLIKTFEVKNKSVINTTITGSKDTILKQEQKTEIIIEDKTKEIKKQHMTENKQNIIESKQNEAENNISIEQNSLNFVTKYWNKDINKISLSKELKDICAKIDKLDVLYKNLNTQINKLNNCAKIKELDPKFGRVQGILIELNKLCLKYNQDFLYEIIALILIYCNLTYEDMFKKTSTNTLIILADAIICFNNKNYEKMAYYLSEIYKKESLNDDNYDNFLFSIKYLLQYGYKNIIDDKLANNNLFKDKKDQILNICNKFKDIIKTQKDAKSKNVFSTISTIATNPIVPTIAAAAIPTIGYLTKKLVKNLDNKELKERVEQLIRKGYGGIDKAYSLVEAEFKKNPENEENSKLLQYVGRVKNNSKKYSSNLPKDDSYYAKAKRELFIYENFKEAERNFEFSINKKEEKYDSAIFDYIDMIGKQYGVKYAINKFESYKNIFNFSIKNKRIKYYEKMFSLYDQIKDNDRMLDILDTLKGLYGDRNNKAKANVYFRIARCQFYKHEYDAAILAATSAINLKYDLETCIKQIVNCYLAQKKYQDAKDFVEKYNKNNEFYEIIERIKMYEFSSEKNIVESNIFSITNDDFVNYYLKNCSYEGINREDKKINKNFTSKDISFLCNRIEETDNIKEKASYNLTAACIEKSINDESNKYYEFISNSMFNYAIFSLTNKMFDNAKSFFISAIRQSKQKEDMERRIIPYYLKCILKDEKSSVGVDFTSKVLMLLVELVKDKFWYKNHWIINDLVLLFNFSKEFRSFFDNNKEQNVCKKIMEELKIKLGITNTNNIWNDIYEKYNEDKDIFNNLYSTLQLDKNLELKDIEKSSNKMKNSLLTTEIDGKYIQDFISCCKNIKEIKQYSDFDNKMRILNKCKNKFNEIKEDARNNLTIFFECYMLKIIDIIFNNLEVKILNLQEDSKPSLRIDIPNTTISNDRTISVTITNEENKSTARNIKLTIMDANKNILVSKKIRETLIGGRSVSTLLKLECSNDSAFTINILLQYSDNENNPCPIVEEQKSISQSRKFNDINNPYVGSGLPLGEDKNNVFFGRDILIEELEKSLTEDRTRSVVIYGQKRTGKTSIFKHLEKKLNKNFIVLSFSAGSEFTSEQSFYKTIKYKIEDYVDSNNITVDIDFNNYNVDDFNSFQRFINIINKKICKPQNKELLLMIDEFTNIYKFIEENKIDDSFMNIWKTMIEQNLFKSALIGQDYMLEFIQKYANQFQVVYKKPVSYLEHKYALDLVTKPISCNMFLENSQEDIVEWFNGQPYYLQTYCYKLVEYLNEIKQNVITKAIANQVKEDMLNSIDQSFFDNLIDSSFKEESDKNYNILSKIAKICDLNDSINMENIDFDEEDRELFDKLVIREIIDYKKNDNKCKIKIPFFHEWIKNNL